MDHLIRHFDHIAETSPKPSSGFWNLETVSVAIFMGGYLCIRLCESFVTFVVPEWVKQEVMRVYRWAPILIPLAFGLTYSKFGKKLFRNDTIPARQGWLCAKCKKALKDTYELRYVQPLEKGGLDRTENQEAVCKSCFEKNIG